MIRNYSSAAILLLSLSLSACGFKPIYATPENGASPLNQQVYVGEIKAPETVYPLISEALHNRIVLKDGQSPKYELTLRATESAQRLAVQIDATVTRYNYRLSGNYKLTDLETGESITGKARAVTSYNIVSSQYSTLFAERTAQEKAARLLAEEIERDLLIRFAEGFENAPPDDESPTYGLEFEGDYEVLEDPDDNVELIETWQDR